MTDPAPTGTSPAMVVLRPGDRVLVTLTEDIEPEQVEEAAVTLKQTFPGVEFTVMSGVASILVSAGG